VDNDDDEGNEADDNPSVVSVEGAEASVANPTDSSKENNSTVCVINIVKLLCYMDRKSPPSYAAIPKKKPPKHPPSQDPPLARMESETSNEDGDRDNKEVQPPTVIAACSQIEHFEQVREGEH